MLLKFKVRGKREAMKLEKLFETYILEARTKDIIQLSLKDADISAQLNLKAATNSTAVSEIGFDTFTVTALHYANIFSIGALLTYSERDLFNLKLIHFITVEIIRWRLGLFGLKLKGEKEIIQ